MTDIRMDRHGNVVKVVAQKSGRKSRRRWLAREVDRHRAGLLSDEGLAEALLSELGWKYDPSQPREPAGGPGGGRWTSGIGPTESTANIGGMVLAEKHKQKIYQLAGNTDAYGDEHAVVIGPDGESSKMIRGNGSSVRIPDAGRGTQGTIHTHPSRKGQTEPSCFSPGDIESHMTHAWKSDNENYTSVVASLSTGSTRVKVYALKGWPKGGPRKVQDEMYDFIRTHTQSRLLHGISNDEWVRQVNNTIKTYATTILGLEWEEAWFDD